MQWTIKHKLLGLTAVALSFVAAVSGTGYWGISTVREAAVAVAITGSAIRNHIEAGVYNDLTRQYSKPRHVHHLRRLVAAAVCHCQPHHYGNHPAFGCIFSALPREGRGQRPNRPCG